MTCNNSERIKVEALQARVEHVTHGEGTVCVDKKKSIQCVLEPMPQLERLRPPSATPITSHVYVRVGILGGDVTGFSFYGVVHL